MNGLRRCALVSRYPVSVSTIADAQLPPILAINTDRSACSTVTLAGLIGRAHVADTKEELVGTSSCDVECPAEDEKNDLLELRAASAEAETASGASESGEEGLHGIEAAVLQLDNNAPKPEEEEEEDDDEEEEEDDDKLLLRI